LDGDRKDQSIERTLYSLKKEEKCKKKGTGEPEGGRTCEPAYKKEERGDDRRGSAGRMKREKRAISIRDLARRIAGDSLIKHETKTSTGRNFRHNLPDLVAPKRGQRRLGSEAGRENSPGRGVEKGYAQARYKAIRRHERTAASNKQVCKTRVRGDKQYGRTAKGSNAVGSRD